MLLLAFSLKALLKKENTNMFSPNIKKDVCALEDTNPPDEKYLRRFTQKMCQLKSDTPIILPLFKTLNYS